MRAASRIAFGATVLVALTVVLPDAAFGHALVGKEDLPVPLWLFAWAGSIVLIISFVGLSVMWTSTRWAEYSWSPVSVGLSRALSSAPVRILCGVVAAALLVAIVYTGFEGTEAPDRNFSVTFVFITIWLGMVGLSALFGDLFAAFNPWAAIARPFSALFNLVAGRAPAAMEYPERLGYWPAAIGLAAFAWLELIYGLGVSSGLKPETVAVATLVYSAWTFTAMTLFGTRQWLEKGETFSVYFGMFARLSPWEWRDGRLGRRPFLAGATRWGELTTTAAVFVIVAIGVTAFDGAQEGALQGLVEWSFDRCEDLGFGPVASHRISSSLVMALVVAAVGGIYMAGVYGMSTVGGGKDFRLLARLFAHTLIPIAMGYLFAHYFSLFVYQEQAQFTYLLSDPLGDGSDLFGTADGTVDYKFMSAEAIWYVQVASLVAGHVAGLVLAHDRALSVFGDVKLATRSQYWMLSAMVAFTCLGLFLLSQ